MKRPLKWVLLELVLWAAVALGTAWILVALSDSILPANF
jgi:hypothetical protein